MNNVRIQIGNQLYDEIEVKLKDVIKEKEYLPGNQFRWFNSRVTINLKLRNLPKIIL
jgi:hypothetical protein